MLIYSIAKTKPSDWVWHSTKMGEFCTECPLTSSHLFLSFSPKCWTSNGQSNQLPRFSLSLNGFCTNLWSHFLQWINGLLPKLPPYLDQTFSSKGWLCRMPSQDSWAWKPALETRGSTFHLLELCRLWKLPAWCQTSSQWKPFCLHRSLATVGNKIQIQWSMTLTDTKLTEYVRLTEKSATTELFI